MKETNKKEQKKSSIFTKETLGVVLILFATLCFLCVITRGLIFSVPGEAVNSFLLGCFGYYAIILCLYAIFEGILLVVDKKLNVIRKRKALISLFFIVLAFLIHIISMGDSSALPYGEYLATSYNMASIGGLATCSGGGLFTGLIAYLFTLLLTNIGGYVVLSVALAVIVYFFVMDIVKGKGKVKRERSRGFRSSFVKSKSQTETIKSVETTEERDYPIESAFDTVPSGTQKLFIVDSDDFALKTNRDYRQEAKTQQSVKYNYNPQTKTFEEKTPTYSKTYDKALQDKLNYIKTPAKIDLESYGTDSASNQKSSITISEPISRDRNSSYVVPETNKTPLSQQKEEKIAPSPLATNTAESHAEQFLDKYIGVEEVTDEKPVAIEKSEDVFAINEGRRRSLNLEDIPYTGETVDGEEESFIVDETPIEVEDKGLFSHSEEPTSIEEITPSVVSGRRARDILFEEPQIANPKEEIEISRETSSMSLMEQIAKQKKEERLREEKLEEECKRAEIEEKKSKVILPPVHVPYVAPKLDLLFDYKPEEDVAEENHEEKMNIILNTLESFKIKAEPVDWIQGPTVTRYELRMPVGTPVTSVLRYDNDLKMWLSSKEGIMIQAPIPGKGLIGVEVANQTRVKVGLKELMLGLKDKKHKDDTIYFALGKDVVGNPVEDDLSKGPHYLVAGTTGSGKSVCLNIMITSIIMRYSPEDVRFILVDPKHVDYVVYEHLPHLLVDEIIDKPEKVVAALTWLYEESERRFEVFKQAGGYAKIEDYNKYVASDTIPKMPRIVMVIDEVADLMQNYKKEMESKIAAIAQKARAAGVHLILATQYPRGDIISTPIKANLPGRIALRVTSGSASQLMLNQPGAEKLLGYGDMLYRNNFMSEPERYQGGIIELEEIKQIVKDIIANNKAYFDQSLTECLAKVDKPQEESPSFVETTSSAGIDSAENNELFIQALALGIENNGLISISQLQRHFQVGYARAGGLIDKMERKGYISKSEGSKPRKVLITKEEFLEKFGSNPDGSII